ncbi:MAG: hypothetical protein LBF89_09510 [Bacteroidales bacterium]|nr:hypothetical protein [Bacteroidales bacterium]
MTNKKFVSAHFSTSFFVLLPLRNASFPGSSGCPKYFGILFGIAGMATVVTVPPEIVILPPMPAPSLCLWP